ncbi:hypothetical protein [Olivibacter ginsenosidimutans]|uniref:hypothetical protein n=1 Tax=Olivibacter ginsenosidimutans TaxID=1176537 RepID=UPI0031EB2943
MEDGNAVIDESISLMSPSPVEKKKGDPVQAGTINGNKTFVMVTEKVGSEVVLPEPIP